MSDLNATRRLLLAGGGAILGAAVLRRPAAVQAADPVSFGVVTQNTGTYAYAGELVTRGATLALEERNHRILGRPLRLVVRDDEGRPAVGARRVAEIVSAENVRY